MTAQKKQYNRETASFALHPEIIRWINDGRTGRQSKSAKVEDALANEMCRDEGWLASNTVTIGDIMEAWGVGLDEMGLLPRVDGAEEWDARFYWLHGHVLLEAQWPDGQWGCIIEEDLDIDSIKTVLMPET